LLFKPNPARSGRPVSPLSGPGTTQRSRKKRTLVHFELNIAQYEFSILYELSFTSKASDCKLKVPQLTFLNPSLYKTDRRVPVKWAFTHNFRGVAAVAYSRRGINKSMHNSDNAIASVFKSHESVFCWWNGGVA